MASQMQRPIVLRAQGGGRARGLCRLQHTGRGARLELQLEALAPGEYHAFALCGGHSRHLGSLSPDVRGRAGLSAETSAVDGVCLACMQGGKIAFPLWGFAEPPQGDWSLPVYMQMKELKAPKAEPKPAPAPLPRLQAGPPEEERIETIYLRLPAVRVTRLAPPKLEALVLTLPERPVPQVTAEPVEPSAPDEPRTLRLPFVQVLPLAEEAVGQSVLRLALVEVTDIAPPPLERVLLELQSEFFPAALEEDEQIIWEEEEPPPEPEMPDPCLPFAAGEPRSRSEAEAYFARLLAENRQVSPFRMANTCWVRVPCAEGLWGSHYLIGLTRHKGLACRLAWAVPGTCARRPPAGLEKHRFFPVRGNRCRGYWVLFVPLTE